MTANRISFESLPKDSLTQDIVKRLENEDLSKIIRVSKTFYSMFQTPLKSAKLLHFARQSNYVEVKKIVHEDPSLMFQHVSYKNQKGIYEKISPLKFAFKILDPYLWNIFYEATQHDITYLTQFCNQLNEQTNHICFDALFNAYNAYTNTYNFWIQQRVTDRELDKAWLNVGKKQRELFTEANHLLKEFCREGYSWNAESNFDAEIDPPPGQAIAYSADSDAYYCESVLPFQPNFGLGVHVTLIRGECRTLACQSSQCRFEIIASQRDVAAFHRFHEIRMTNLATLRSKLESILENTDKIKMKSC